MQPILLKAFKHEHMIYGLWTCRQGDDLVPTVIGRKAKLFLWSSVKSARLNALECTRDILTQTLLWGNRLQFFFVLIITNRLEMSVTRFDSFFRRPKLVKLSADQFEAADWDSLHLTIQQKNEMYSLWLAKQASKFCDTGTRKQVARMTEGADDRCLNCLAPLCTQQFEELVSELTKWWLQKEHTHPEIAFWLPRNLLATTAPSPICLLTMVRLVWTSECHHKWRQLLSVKTRLVGITCLKVKGR